MVVGLTDINTFYYFMDCGTFESMLPDTQDEFYQFMIDEWFYRVRLKHEIKNMPSAEE